MEGNSTPPACYAVFVLNSISRIEVKQRASFGNC